MTSTEAADALTPVDEEAIGWLMRLRAPDGAGAQAAFEDWYSADPLHADAYDRVLTSWDQLDVARKTPLGRTRRRFFGATAPSPCRRYALGAVAAAAIVAMVSIGGGPLGFGQDPLIPSAYASVIGEIRTVTLTDGSRVTLDTDTAVQTAYNREERRVRLVRGRARFKVAADRRPFIVDADEGSVIAKGTSFDVDATGGRLAVSLYEGHVDVTGPAADHVQSLAPGQTLTFSANGPAGRLGVVDAADARWTSGMLSFDDASLADVVERANRYGRVKIILGDDATQKLRFTGTFRASATEELSRMLVAAFTLQLTRDRLGNLTLRDSASRSKR